MSHNPFERSFIFYNKDVFNVTPPKESSTKNFTEKYQKSFVEDYDRDDQE